jgi:hypothetical protein
MFYFNSFINFFLFQFVLLRLSSLVGDKLTKGNPAITDLGDPNRPMKIADKYGGLYDNEWTDAMQYSDDVMRTLFPAVDHQMFDEILVYHLHRLVMVCKVLIEYSSYVFK